MFGHRAFQEWNELTKEMCKEMKFRTLSLLHFLHQCFDFLTGGYTWANGKNMSLRVCFFVQKWLWDRDLEARGRKCSAEWCRAWGLFGVSLFHDSLANVLLSASTKTGPNQEKARIAKTRHIFLAVQRPFIPLTSSELCCHSIAFVAGHWSASPYFWLFYCLLR